ncbi:hypothetical protein MCEMRE193_00913 [Candidatus Nanopelagicaceae bacterium]
MNIPFIDDKEITMSNIRRMAKRRGRRDGRAEKPSLTWDAGSVPFISHAHAQYAAEGEKFVKQTRKKLNDRVYETLERDEQIHLLQSQLEKLEGSITEAELRVKHFKNELDGYKEENPIGRFARTRLIPDKLYWFVLAILISGEILVTAPALVQLFGEGKWQSWIISIAVGFLPVAGAHLIGTFLKSRLDRQRPQESWVKWLYLAVFVILLFAIFALGILRAGITEGNLLDFTIVPQDKTKQFLILFFVALQLSFFTVAVGLGFLHHSPSAEALKEAKKELAKLKEDEKNIQNPLMKYKSRSRLTVDEVDANLRELASEVEILEKEHDITVSVYREANIHARRDEIDGGHIALQALEITIDIEKFQDVYDALQSTSMSNKSTPGNLGINS